MSWLTEHFDKFVRPIIGDNTLPDATESYFSPLEMSYIKNVWKAVKQRAYKHTLILGGRDTWLFEVLARRENFTTVYYPKLSRVTALRFRREVHRHQNPLMFDTGFVGSIPNDLNVPFVLFSHAACFARFSTPTNTCQVFPNMKIARQLALKIEYAPKYFQSARIVGGAIIQNLASKDEIKRAALLTKQIYTDSTSRKAYVRTHRTRLHKSLLEQVPSSY